MAAGLDEIRARLNRRFREALDEFPAGEEVVAEPPRAAPLASSLSVLRRDYGGADVPDKVRDLEALLGRSQAELEAVRAQYAGATAQLEMLGHLREKYEKDQSQAAGLLERLASKESEAAALRASVQRLEAAVTERQAERDAARAELEGARERAAAGDADRELSYAALEKRLAERTELAREKAERAQKLEAQLADNEKNFAEQLAALQKEREDARASLQKRENESRLTAENVNRLSQQNKELISQLRQTGSPAAKALPPEEPRVVQDPALLEKLQSLEQELHNREKVFEGQQKVAEQRAAQYEAVARELDALKAAQGGAAEALQKLEDVKAERDNLAQAFEDAKRRAEALSDENRALKERPAAAAPAALPADYAAVEAAWAERLAAADRRAVDIEKRAVQLETELKHKTEEFQKSAQACDELKFKNEELESQVRLLILNSESIERMEKGLRESFRLMSTDLPHMPPAAPPVPPQPGVFKRFMLWWTAPLLRIGGKKPVAAAPGDAAVPRTVPPGVERLRQIRAQRNQSR